MDKIAFFNLVDKATESLTPEEERDLRQFLVSGAMLKAFNRTVVQTAAMLTDSLVEFDPYVNATEICRRQGKIRQCMAVLEDLWDLTKEATDAKD